MVIESLEIIVQMKIMYLLDNLEVMKIVKIISNVKQIYVLMEIV